MSEEYEATEIKALRSQLLDVRRVLDSDATHGFPTPFEHDASLIGFDVFMRLLDARNAARDAKVRIEELQLQLLDAERIKQQELGLAALSARMNMNKLAERLNAARDEIRKLKDRRA